MSVQVVGEMVRVIKVEDGMLQENVSVGMQVGAVGHEEKVFTVMLQGSVTGVTILPTLGNQGIVEWLMMTFRMGWMTPRQLRGSRNWSSRQMLNSWQRRKRLLLLTLLSIQGTKP